eukprot:TRINITY_DN111133_c0_g1_i1.p1 TRINITY_DN111133_c0_g1~~TRINITY_DN111133_c0_g1_i1.p1  ORF type:complete len:146 (+),score=18.82 TRINITY_DN111133_c0_g1_i1:55-492(+)
MAGKYSKATEDAKRYADQHDLERLVTQMVNSLMANKPEDPQTHMLRWLLEQTSPEQARAAPVKIVRDLDAPKVLTQPEERTRAMYDKLNMGGKPRPADTYKVGGVRKNSSEVFSKNDSKLTPPVMPNRPGSSSGVDSRVASDVAS